MKSIFVSILWVLTFVCIILPTTNASGGSDEAELSRLSKEYLRLKARKKALKQGVFDAELSGAGGRFSQVLFELGEKLGKPNTPVAAVTRYMGKPDAIKRAGDHQPGSPGGRVGAGDVHLIYFWRGWHDYLYFVCLNDVVVKVLNYAALE